jgi:hypothetical protein
MIDTAAPLVLTISASLFAIGAIVSIVRFRRKVKLIRSLSDNRDLDVYVPYNMLFYGASHLSYRRIKAGMAFPYDANNEAVLQELRNSWVVSLILILTIWFALGTGFLALISHFNE